MKWFNGRPLARGLGCIVLAAVLICAFYIFSFFVTPRGRLLTPRFGHSAVLLPDGRVFIFGGWRRSTFQELEWQKLLNFLDIRKRIVLRDSSDRSTTYSEVYDPRTNTFTQGVSLSANAFSIEDKLVMMYPDGSFGIYDLKSLMTTSPSDVHANRTVRVSGVIGSLHKKVLFFVDFSESAEFDVSSSSQEKPEHIVSAFGPFGPTLVSQLNNGNLLAIGFPGDLDGCKIYDWGSHLWSSVGGTLENVTDSDCSERLPNGKVLLVHSTNGNCEIFNPNTQKWSPAGTIGDPLCDGGSMVTLNDGRILELGEHCYIYNPTSGLWKKTGSMHQARSFNTTTVIKNGKVLVTGGTPLPQATTDDQALSSCELYDPTTGKWTEL